MVSMRALVIVMVSWLFYVTNLFAYNNLSDHAVANFEWILKRVQLRGHIDPRTAATNQISYQPLQGLRMGQGGYFLGRVYSELKKVIDNDEKFERFMATGEYRLKHYERRALLPPEEAVEVVLVIDPEPDQFDPELDEDQLPAVVAYIHNGHHGFLASLLTRSEFVPVFVTHNFIDKVFKTRQEMHAFLMEQGLVFPLQNDGRSMELGQVSAMRHNPLLGLARALVAKVRVDESGVREIKSNIKYPLWMKIRGKNHQFSSSHDENMVALWLSSIGYQWHGKELSPEELEALRALAVRDKNTIFLQDVILFERPVTTEIMYQLDTVISAVRTRLRAVFAKTNPFEEAIDAAAHLTAPRISPVVRRAACVSLFRSIP